MTFEAPSSGADSGSGAAAPSKGSWRKTIVTVVVIASLTLLAWKYPQFAGEAIVGFLGLVGIHSQAAT